MDRDPIIGKGPNTGSPSRADKLNGENRTKSVNHGGANFSNVSPKRNSAPPPNNPYSK